MEGIQFVVNANGKKTAVIIYLERYAELLEDFFDVVISAHRLETEPDLSWEEVMDEQPVEVEAV